MTLFLWDRYLSQNQWHAVAAGLGCQQDLARARELAALCAGLHDIGKLTGFQLCSAHGRQRLSRELLGDMGRIGVERLPHDVAGMHAASSAVLDVLGFPRGGDSPKAAIHRVAEIIGGHHGVFHQHVHWHPDNADLLGGAAWAEQRAAHARAVFELLGEPAPPEEIEGAAAVLITGLVVLADWLVSQEHYLRARQAELEQSLSDHFARSYADAEALVREAGLLPVELERKDFAEAYGIVGKPNPLQRSVAEELPAFLVARGRNGGRRGCRKGGILLVTAAPGDGKSETALEAERVLAECFGTRGFAFLLPTMATSDQMYLRVSGVVARQAGQDAGLTLTHSMAWLNSAYAEDGRDDLRVLTGEAEEDDAGAATGREVDMRPRRWLRGAKRALLAQFAVGTVDQALMSVLPVRHNALRLLALSNKTFIVDEAHAYDPYMQVLLGRLLNWLGWYGVPVVLLSATLPTSVSDRLIKEYLRGTKAMPVSRLKKLTFVAPYPGWLYVDGADGECTQISPERQVEQAAARSLHLAVQVEPVVHGKAGGELNRLAVIERLLTPVMGNAGGCALVVCNTVAEAQDTYKHVKALAAARGCRAGEVQLLHARIPGDEREERTKKVTEGLGRSGPRPLRRIVVATQVVEQSLDLDADVVISDLAPLALLLQRAGRCWRHEAWWSEHERLRARPGWADRPRLVVLDPLAAGRGVPYQWGEVYAEFLLRATSEVLVQRGDKPVSVPGDVQGLVEEVHGHQAEEFCWDDPAQSVAYTAYKGKELADRSVGGLLVIPRARSVAGLDGLHHLEGAQDEWEASTRLGSDAVRLLCVYGHADGVVTLDADGKQPLPGIEEPLTRADVKTVMARTIPVTADWFRGERDAHRVPQEWAEHPMLGDLVMVRQPVIAGGVQPVAVGGKHIHLDAELGLIRA